MLIPGLNKHIPEGADAEKSRSVAKKPDLFLIMAARITHERAPRGPSHNQLGYCSAQRSRKPESPRDSGPCRSSCEGSILPRTHRTVIREIISRRLAEDLRG